MVVPSTFSGVFKACCAAEEIALAYLMLSLTKCSSSPKTASSFVLVTSEKLVVSNFNLFVEVRVIPRLFNESSYSENRLSILSMYFVSFLEPVIPDAEDIKSL